MLRTAPFGPSAVLGVVILLACQLCGCSPQPSPTATQAAAISSSSSSLSYDEGLLAEDIFFMCSNPNLAVYDRFHFKSTPLPNEQKARQFAETIFNTVFGEDIMADEQPLNVVLFNDDTNEPPGISRYNGNWVITGHWDQPPTKKGGVAMMIVSPQTGKILCLGHGK